MKRILATAAAKIKAYFSQKENLFDLVVTAILFSIGLIIVSYVILHRMPIIKDTAIETISFAVGCMIYRIFIKDKRN